MKIRHSFLGISILLFAWLCVSCNNLDAIHEKYLIEERTYLGKPDSLKAYPGAGKVKLTWYQNSDPRIETTVIYWNLREDSVVHTFNRKPFGGFQKDSIIIDRDLEEGSNNFELINRGGKEKSLVSSVQGEVFGESYIERLRIRSIESIRMTEFNEETGNALVQINWNTPPSNCVGTILRYKKFPSGEEISVRIESTDAQTELEEVGNRLLHPDDILYLSSLYLPVGAIDTLVSPELKQQIVSYKVSAGSWTERDPATGATLNSDEYAMPPDIIKYIWTTVPQNNISILDCDRFGNLDPYVNFTLKLFRFTLNPDNTVDVSGYSNISNNNVEYLVSNTGSNRWEPQRKSVYNPATRVFQMVYKRQKDGENIFIYEETLAPR